MPKFKFSAYNLFLVYLGVLLSFFVYAGLTGTRILGDDKEEFKPEGVQGQSNYNRGPRLYRSYHK